MVVFGGPDPGLGAVMGERRRLINLTYRLLGSLAEAEDAVQETYACWYAMTPQQQEAIENPRAWLSKVASRICLNLLGSARVRQETYVGEWIPEPLPERAEWITGRPRGTTMDPGATAIADSGGLVSAVLQLLKGGEQIARASADFAGRAPGLTILERTVNGQPGLVAQQNGITVAVMAFDFAGDRIKHIWVILNPEKLRPWTTG